MAKPVSRDARPFRFAGFDLVLLLLAVAGFAVFFLLLPPSMPDSTARYDLSESEAIDRGNIFLSNQGFAASNLEVEAHLRRNSTLLTQMQRTLGRSRTVEVLREEDRNILAGYHWSLEYSFSDPEEEGLLSGADQVFSVDLTMDGSVLSFDNFTGQMGVAGRRFGSATTAINKSALAAALKPDTSTVDETRSLLNGIADSTILSSVRFGFRLPGARAAGARARALTLLQENRPVLLDSTALDGIVRYHIDRTALSSVTWATDSLFVQQGSDGRVAQIRLVSESPVHEQNMRLSAEVTSTGSLQSLDLEYNPNAEEVTNLVMIVAFSRLGLYILIGAILVVVFFRRMYARVIDVKQAMIDSVLVGVTTGIFVAMTMAGFSVDMGNLPMWAELFWRFVSFSIAAGAIALFAFMVSGVTESVARETFAPRLRTLTLMRQGDFQNRPMGAALLRGTLLGGLILGLCTLALWWIPSLSLEHAAEFLSESSIRPMISVLLGTFSASYFISLIWLFGIGSILYRISPKPGIFVPLAALIAGLLQITPALFENGLESVFISVVVGAILAWGFLRFDILTVLTGMFIARLMWRLSEGFVVAGTSTWVDATLGTLFVLSVLILGFVGVLSRRTGKDIKEYVPEYVTEMAGQERVKRELELAHQVQASFLPRTMPRIEHLDIAGMCLPAQEVGGDYFDFIKLSDTRLAFVVGDVSGKGIHAAFFMTLVKGIIQTLSRQEKSPAELLRILNHLFCENAPSGTFISMIYGVVDVSDRSFTFARAGHNPAIMHRAGAPKAEVLCPAGMAIGFSDGDVFDANIEEKTVTLRNGDTLVFYTDGFSEAMNSSRDLYGDERLADKVGQVGSRSASAILRLLTEDVHHFIEGAGRADDMTMVVIKLGTS